jgi:hypothetical protein
MRFADKRQAGRAAIVPKSVRVRALSFVASGLPTVSMYLYLIDDAHQRECPRDGINEIVAVGGIIIRVTAARDLEAAIEAVCRDFGFPRGEVFKWSAAATITHVKSVRMRRGTVLAASIFPQLGHIYPPHDFSGEKEQALGVLLGLCGAEARPHGGA